MAAESKTRWSDIPGLRLPSSKAVVAREHHLWGLALVVIDSARESLAQSLAKVEAAFQ